MKVGLINIGYIGTDCWKTSCRGNKWNNKEWNLTYLNRKWLIKENIEESLKYKNFVSFLYNKSLYTEVLNDISVV